jgi:hypothetical protein
MSALTLPASTAWLESEDLQASENSATRDDVVEVLGIDAENLDNLVRVLRNFQRPLPTVMISGSFDTESVANNVYNNVVLPEVKDRDELDESDVTKTTDRGFAQLSNSQLGQFAINDEVVIVQNGISVDGEFDIGPFLDLYDGDASTLFEANDRAGSLFSMLDLQPTAGWIDLDSYPENSRFVVGTRGPVKPRRLIDAGALQVAHTGTKASTTFAADFESEPTDSTIAQIEDGSVFTHIETSGQAASFEVSDEKAEAQGL